MALDLKPPVTIEQLRENWKDLKTAEDYLKKGHAAGFELSDQLKGINDRKQRVRQMRDAWYSGQPL